MMQVVTSKPFFRTKSTKYWMVIRLSVFAACTFPFLSGCSICDSPFDDDYPVYGGRWQRADQTHGRVGSIFSGPVEPGVVTEEVVEGEVISGGSGLSTGEVVEEIIEDPVSTGEYVDTQIEPW